MQRKNILVSPCSLHSYILCPPHGGHAPECSLTGTWWYSSTCRQQAPGKLQSCYRLGLDFSRLH